MLGWLKKALGLPTAAATVAQPPNEPFPWPAGVTLTALDEVILALPAALFNADRPMGAVVQGPADMAFSYTPGEDVFLIRLQPGMAVRLTKPCRAYVVADDGRPRRLTRAGP